MRKHANVDTSRGANQATNRTTEYARAQISFGAVTHKNLRDRVSASILQDGFDGVVALEDLDIGTGIARLGQAVFKRLALVLGEIWTSHIDDQDVAVEARGVPARRCNHGIDACAAGERNDEFSVRARSR